MAKDKVLHPGEAPKGKGTAPNVKQGIIEGPTHQPGKYNPYTRDQKPKK